MSSLRDECPVCGRPTVEAAEGEVRVDMVIRSGVYDDCQHTVFVLSSPPELTR